jgi:hypothetical protein
MRNTTSLFFKWQPLNIIFGLMDFFPIILIQQILLSIQYWLNECYLKLKKKNYFVDTYFLILILLFTHYLFTIQFTKIIYISYSINCSKVPPLFWMHASNWRNHTTNIWKSTYFIFSCFYFCHNLWVLKIKDIFVIYPYLLKWHYIGIFIFKDLLWDSLSESCVIAVLVVLRFRLIIVNWYYKVKVWILSK